MQGEFSRCVIHGTSLRRAALQAGRRCRDDACPVRGDDLYTFARNERLHPRTREGSIPRWPRTVVVICDITTHDGQ